MNRQIFVMLTAIFVLLVSIGCGDQPASDEPPASPAAAQDEDEEATDEEEEADDEEATDEEEEADDEEADDEEAMDEEEEEEATPEDEEEEEATPEPVEGGRLEAVIERGNVICGINGGLAGFGVQEADGTFTGFDVDFCRVVAAAIFGDPEAVEFVPLTAQERFTAVQAGTVDVLFRNTTWTLSRDTTVFLDFGPTTFYDGQGIMTRSEFDIASLEDLSGATICVQSGTTTELNLTDQFRARGIEFEPVVFEEIDPTYTAYDEGRCDAVTSDRSQLIARRTTMQNPDEHVILDAVLSKEPLGPAMSQGDSQWRDVVEWSVFATIQAEELGINSENIEEFMDSENPDVRRFLGLEGDLGEGMGLENDFAVQIIENVGNYGEIYNRNLGPDTPFDLARGPNSIWTEGGLLYSPPFR